MEQKWDVVVVGAGLAGLTAAATASTRSNSVLLLDGREPGGRATTDSVSRFRFNRAPTPSTAADRAEVSSTGSVSTWSARPACCACPGRRSGRAPPPVLFEIDALAVRTAV